MEFLKHIPAEQLPKRYFPSSPFYLPILFHYGWETSFDEIYEWARIHCPNDLAWRGKENTVPNIYLTSYYAMPRLAEACGLPSLKLKLAFVGPLRSNCSPVLTIANNRLPAAERQKMEQLSEKLRRMFGLEGNPRWYVDSDNVQWPKSFEVCLPFG